MLISSTQIHKEREKKINIFCHISLFGCQIVRNLRSTIFLSPERLNTPFISVLICCLATVDLILKVSVSLYYVVLLFSSASPEWNHSFFFYQSSDKREFHRSSVTAGGEMRCSFQWRFSLRRSVAGDECFNRSFNLFSHVVASYLLSWGIL